MYAIVYVKFSQLNKASLPAKLFTNPGEEVCIYNATAYTHTQIPGCV